MRLAFFIIIVIWPSTLLWADLESTSGSESSEGWVDVFQEEGISVQARAMRSKSISAYRAKGVLNAPVGQILELLADTTTSAEWIPDLIQKSVITQFSATETVTFGVYNAPFSFKDRELLLHNRLRLDYRRGALLAEAVSITDPMVPLTKGNVRAIMHCSQTWLRPLSENQTEIDFIMLLEPRGRIPIMLANIGMRRTPFNFVKALESRAKITNYSLRAVYREMLDQIIAK